MSYSYKGKILISTPDLSGDVFSRSLVLLLEHTSDGAFGLILNKKKDESFFITDSSEVTKNSVWFEGGPVEPDRKFFIIKGQTEQEDSIWINENYYATENYKSIIKGVLDEEIDLLNIKFFAGYSGWFAGQLESEIARKAWTPVDVPNLDYTARYDDNLWKKLMQKLGGDYLLWANAPEDISMN
ncbi:YqgE/AlgH family protein [Chryseobacterium sp. A301]